MRGLWSDGECLAAVGVARGCTLGVLTPRAYDQVRGDCPSSHALAARFGSWGEVLRRADPAPPPDISARATVARPPARTWTREECLDAVRVFAQAQRGPATTPAYARYHETHNDTPALSAITRLCGSWRQACQDAGVESGVGRSPVGGRWTRDECLDAIRAVAVRWDEPLTTGIYERERGQGPSFPMIVAMCGSWPQACQDAGVDPWSEDRVAAAASRRSATAIAALRRVGASHPGAVTVSMYAQHRAPGDPTVSMVVRWCDSWSQACRLAGVPTSRSA